MKSFIFLSFLTWRILLFICSYIGSLLLEFRPRFPYSDIWLIPSGLPSWIWSFANFDGVHYLTIASQGYWAQFTQVFFPFYPVILSLFSNLLFFINPLGASILASNIFFLF